MAKEKSPQVVSEESDYERRFQKLEEDSAKTSGLVEQLAEKLLGEKIEKPAPKEKGEPKPPVPAKSFKGFMESIGLFRPESGE